MVQAKISIFILSVMLCLQVNAQNVPILSSSINNAGQVELEIEGRSDQYYLLTTLHEPSLDYESITSMTIGVDGNMIISEPLAAFPFVNYTVTAFPIANPADTDGDGEYDITEFNNMPTRSPLNFAREIPFTDGTSAIDHPDIFSDLAVVNDDIPWAPFLNNQEFAKFAIVNQDTDEPEIYFINSKTHFIHADFLATINVDQYGDDVVTGEIVYNPNEILPNGVIGSYSFNYSFGQSYSFSHTRRTFELLAANMPFLKNNFQHFIGNIGENSYLNIYRNDFVGSRVPVVLESELFADIDFLPFNQAEGFGFFRLMSLDENPGSRDIVLYETLPNSLPRVGGIITSVVQTPLSHVNLRAIQDNVPNAYIREPLMIDSIANLLGKYIYYKVEQDKYQIREASLEEVNEWYEGIRPTEDQIPDRDLSQTKILPLSEITFGMSNAFGAKCANVATMRNFGFPEGTIPNGFGVPFYFYDEFMKYNDFYDQAETMISDPLFISDLEVRIDMLKDFRKDIRAADMPQWMLDELQAMHESFPEGTSIRCRSSTNNEDLPGFSGAGLYTSKTQHPDEGHISKSIKQVYASMWNFRAYDERDFYRVDQYIAAMGVLCHPNYEDEKSNGVGVSIDPIYQTDNTFYLNTQVGESLITNPEANAIPEEILLNQDPNEGYFILRRSNLVADGELVMGEEYLEQMRNYLKVIHDEFEILYNVVGAEGFGMDIEYKVTKENQLIIKQARPWVSFWADIKATFDLAVVRVVDPKSSASLSDMELVTVEVSNTGLRDMQDFDISLMVDGQLKETITINDVINPQHSNEYQFTIPQDFSEIRDYNLTTIITHDNDGYTTNDTLHSVISKLHLLEAGISASLDQVNCGKEIEAIARVTNSGQTTFNNTEIEVVVNGSAVDTVKYELSIPYQITIDIPITITENLQTENNEIRLNLISVNGQTDAIASNNSSSFTTDLDAENIFVQLVVQVDDFPAENTWWIFDEETDELAAFGGFQNTDFTENICLYNSCFTLVVTDSYGDGICCGYGMGSFMLLDSVGDTLVSNNGDFGSEAEEPFCTSGACLLTAEIALTKASDENTADGTITINPSNGLAPYEYSIDGGLNFLPDNVFENLLPGEYMVVVKDASENCIYEEIVDLGFEISSSTGEVLSNNLKLYPNPTDGPVYITMDQQNLSENINIEVFDKLGRLMLSDIIKVQEGNETTISLDSYPAGSYVIKCFSRSFEKYSRIIKI